jgi:hypothetical protein
MVRKLIWLTEKTTRLLAGSGLGVPSAVGSLSFERLFRSALRRSTDSRFEMSLESMIAVTLQAELEGGDSSQRNVGRQTRQP